MVVVPRLPSSCPKPFVRCSRHSCRAVTFSSAPPVVASVCLGCLQNDKIGDLIDQRPTDGRPSYDYLNTKPERELCELWKRALDGQMADILKFEVSLRHALHHPNGLRRSPHPRLLDAPSLS